MPQIMLFSLEPMVVSLSRQGDKGLCHELTVKMARNTEIRSNFSMERKERQCSLGCSLYTGTRLYRQAKGFTTFLAEM